jgi:OHCU decarboxylase
MNLTTKLSLDSLNQMSCERFLDSLGWVFEHSPWVLERAWRFRPFSSYENLLDKLGEVVKRSEINEQLGLLRAHPNLAGKLKMTDASVKEQQGAGLDQLSPEEYEQFTLSNQAYNEKFGFPFIMAVRNENKDSIYSALQIRLHGELENERELALKEVLKIANFRLSDTVMENSQRGGTQ